MPQSNLLTVQEVADLLKIRKNTAYELIKRGELPSKKVGKQIRVSEGDVLRYLNLPESDPDFVSLPQRQPDLQGQKIDKIVLCGQDISLDIIANHVSALPGQPGILRSHAGSYNSLYALYQGRAQISTAHLWDEKTGEYNYPYILRLVPGVPLIVVRLFGRKQGFYVKKGNPKNITGWKDVARGDLMLCNREKGSGTRVLLDEKLKTMAFQRSLIPGYEREYASHVSVAGAVARGEGDFGLGSEHGCQQVGGIEFIPLQNECYDMVFPAELREFKPYHAVLDYVCSERFILELTGIGGYDTSQTGKTVLL